LTIKHRSSAAGKTVLLIVTALVVLLLPACSSPAASTVSSGFELLEDSTTISVRLYGIMEYATYGIRFTHPTTLEVLTVPTGWMNYSFRGFDLRQEATQTITDQVHGTVTADAGWITNLVYTRYLTRSSDNDGVFYKVVMNNIPIIEITEGFAQAYVAGADIRKYVESVEYYEQSVLNGQLVITTTYLSTDWQQDIGGQAPYILVLFEEGEGAGLPPC